MPQRYSSRNLSAPIKANLHFSLSRSGVLTLDRSEAVIEIFEWIEVPNKILTLENSTAPVNIMREASGPANVSTETGNGDSIEENNVNLSTDYSATDKNTAKVTEKKLKKRTFRVPLKVVEKTRGPVFSLSEESLSHAKRKLVELNKKDADRRRTAELKNNLEGYIYSTREKIESSGESEQILTNEERQSFIVKLEEVQDWLYMDGEDASAGKFEEQLSMLKSIGDPIFFRLEELTARPAVVELARRYLSEVAEIVRGLEMNKSWIPNERMDEILSRATNFRKWLDEKQAEQDRTPASSVAVFTSEEVYEKLADLQAKVASVNRIPKPKPKVKKPVKNKQETSFSSDTSEENISQEAPENTKGSATDNETVEPGHDELR